MASTIGEEMTIETSRGSEGEASPKLIRELMNDDIRRGEFIILSRSEEAYLQGCGDKEPFHVEYREGGEAEHYYAKEKLTKTELEELMLRYLEEKLDWKSPYEWARLAELEGDSTMTWDVTWS